MLNKYKYSYIVAGLILNISINAYTVRDIPAIPIMLPPDYMSSVVEYLPGGNNSQNNVFLTQNSVGTNYISVSWTPSIYAVKQSIYLNKVLCNNTPFNDDTTKTATCYGLNPSTAYDVILETYDSNGNEWSSSNTLYLSTTSAAITNTNTGTSTNTNTGTNTNNGITTTATTISNIFASTNTVTNNGITTITINDSDSVSKKIEINNNGEMSMSVNKAVINTPKDTVITKTDTGDIKQTITTSNNVVAQITTTKTGDISATLTNSSGQSTSLNISKNAEVKVDTTGNITQTIKNNNISTEIKTSNNGSAVSKVIDTVTGKTTEVNIPAGTQIQSNDDGSTKSTLNITNNKVEVSTSNNGTTTSQITSNTGDTKSIDIPAGATTTVSSTGIVQSNIQTNLVEGQAQANIICKPNAPSQATVNITDNNNVQKSIDYTMPGAALNSSISIILNENFKTLSSLRAKLPSRIVANYSSRAELNFINTISNKYVDPNAIVTSSIIPNGLTSLTENKYFSGQEDIAIANGSADINTNLSISGLNRSISMPSVTQGIVSGSGILSVSNNTIINGNSVNTSVNTDIYGNINAIASIPDTNSYFRSVNKRLKLPNKIVANYSSRSEISNIIFKVNYTNPYSTERELNSSYGSFNVKYTTDKVLDFKFDNDYVVKRNIDKVSIIPSISSVFEENQNFNGNKDIKLISGKAIFNSNNLNQNMDINKVYLLPATYASCADCEVYQDINLNIKKGWNLISIPVNTTRTSAIFNKIGFKKVFVQRSKEYGKYTENPEYINPGEGIWLFNETNNTINLNFTGNSYKPDFGALDSNWSLIGTGVKIDYIYPNWGIEKAWGYRDGMFVDLLANTTDAIQPGEGFWVKKQFKLNILNGWNLISIPTQIDKYITRDLLKDDNYKAYVYRNNSYELNPTYINQGEGFWLKNTKSDSSVIFEGKPFINNIANYSNSTNANLFSNWNLIGTGKDFEATSLIPFYNMWLFRNGEWHTPRVNVLTEVQNGEGLWIKKR